MTRVVPAIAFAAILSLPLLASAQSPSYVQQPMQQPSPGYPSVPNQSAQVQVPSRGIRRYVTPAGTPVNTQPQPIPTQPMPMQQMPMQQAPMQPQRGQRASGPMAGRYESADMARSACGGDQVVWANTSTKVYHMQDSTFFGKTKHGAFMCERNAETGGFHASKGG